MEFANVIEDLMSSMNQLKSMLAVEAGAQVEPTDIMEPMEATEDQDMLEKGTGSEEDENMIEKGLEQTPSDGATASDDVEERVEDPQTDQGEANENEVVKQLLSLLSKNTVKKSVSKEDKVVAAVNELTQVVKTLANRTNDTELAVKNILEGFGISEQVNKSVTATTKQMPQRQPEDIEAVVKSLGAILKGDSKSETTSHFKKG
jgi:phosphopantothenate synthetase